MPASRGSQLVAAVATRMLKVPPAPVVRRAVKDYAVQAGMTEGELAAHVGYGRSSVKFFLAGSYRHVAGDDRYIRTSLWAFMQNHPLADDEEVPKRLLNTADTRTLLGLCHEARTKGRIIIAEGPPGTSKTTALRWYVAERKRLREHDAIYLRAITGISGPELLRRLSAACASKTHFGRGIMLDRVVRRLRRRQPVLLIDEAQHLLHVSGGRQNADPFEQLRDILDMTGCGCVLAGHFTFVQALSNGFGRQLEQWLSRIDLHEHLRGVRAEELPELERQWLGEELPSNIRKRVVAACLARDRNAFLRTRLLPPKTEPLPLRYLSIRRLRKFFERLEELRELPENQHQKPAALAEGALRLLLQPAGRAL